MSQRSNREIQTSTEFQFSVMIKKANSDLRDRKGESARGEAVPTMDPVRVVGRCEALVQSCRLEYVTALRSWPASN